MAIRPVTTSLTELFSRTNDHKILYVKMGAYITLFQASRRDLPTPSTESHMYSQLN